MVATQYDEKDGSWCLILRPNVALSWRQAKLFLLFTAGVCFAAAGVFALMGMWLILPFVGLEIGALTLALIITAQRAYDTEVVHVSESKVEIDKGRRRPERHWSFDRLWSEVILAGPGHPWYPTRLAVRSRGEQVELGRFLADEERARVAGELRRWIGPMAGLGGPIARLRISPAIERKDGATHRKA
ncbi:DUF2244 domain-containing protein [Nitrococcus mobilis]|uniref:Integral membrane protein n=1 Tax=Nitrococcus mobilis Nb-231 TaxID=314278 RepID=A4BQS4_9GAMM|nr:DUF2244 domain-containing protein [Nitrococcus mobilis]EAR21924.1 hypothetical protein NB231_06036 [Nitrococcus mobilis Nb-231]